MRLTTRTPEAAPIDPEKVPLSNARQQEVDGTQHELKRAVGRPRCQVNGEEVRELRRRKVSWRRIARALGIGTATAMRLYDASSGAPGASQNSQHPEAGRL